MGFKEDIEEVISELDYVVTRVKHYNESIAEHLTTNKLEQLIGSLRYTRLEADEMFKEGYEMGYRDGQREMEIQDR
jgi:hypothetical protein